MTPTAKAPVFFISHGAPTFATEPGQLGPLLQTIGQGLVATRAVLVVSPHWQSRDLLVMTTAQPETVHDFGGFAAELYALQYPAVGQPELAVSAAALLTQAGFTVSLDARRGLDHGAWVPLMHLLPQAKVPVFQVSMPTRLTTAQALQVGQALACLRTQGVVIVCSGSMTHNLYELRQPGAQPVPYAGEFTAWVRSAVVTRGIGRVVNYRAEAPNAERAHPSDEHFLPLLVALGATVETDPVRVLDGGITYGVLSMESYVWGLA